MWLYASAFFYTAARSGACERTCSADFVASITAACAPCAGSTLPTPFATTFQQAAFSPVLVSSLLKTYYHRRLLRWAGHVSRMPLNRLPRMLLTGWVANPRPLGCPQMTWGRTLKKALSSHGLPTDFVAWHQLAADRCAWRQVCGGSAGPTQNATKDRQAIWEELRNGPKKV